MNERNKVCVLLTRPVNVFVLIAALALPHNNSVSMEVHVTVEELSEEADRIVAVEVVGQRSFLREDDKGRHIYTEVILRPLESLKGTDSDSTITLEVIGGTFERWREEVSYSPVFENGERSVLFLQVEPNRLVAARQGKRTLRDGKFTIDGVHITPSDFGRALHEHQAKRSRGESASLHSLIKAIGEPQERAVFKASPSAVDTLCSPSKNKVDAPNVPRDLGGGTIPREQLPVIQK